MAKSVFTFPCPCCDKMVEVDTRSGKARAVRADDPEGALEALKEGFEIGVGRRGDALHQGTLGNVGYSLAVPRPVHLGR